jgi:hypothetical protein
MEFVCELSVALQWIVDAGKLRAGNSNRVRPSGIAHKLSQRHIDVLPTHILAFIPRFERSTRKELQILRTAYNR